MLTLLVNILIAGVYLFAPMAWVDGTYIIAGILSATVACLSYRHTGMISDRFRLFQIIISAIAIGAFFGTNYQLQSNTVNDGFYFDMVGNILIGPLCVIWLIKIVDTGNFESFGISSFILWIGIAFNVFLLDLALSEYSPQNNPQKLAHYLNIAAIISVGAALALAIQIRIQVRLPLAAKRLLLLSVIFFFGRLLLIRINTMTGWLDDQTLGRVSAALYALAVGLNLMTIKKLKSANFVFPVKTKSTRLAYASGLPILPLALCIPLSALTCEILGISMPLNQLSAALSSMLVLLAVIAVVLWQSHKIQDQKQHLQTLLDQDDLTGLLSRRGWSNALNTIDRDHWLVTIDLNHFKPINDLHGHHFGDEVLRWVASLLNASPNITAAARVSGDEFHCIMRTASVEVDLGALSQKLNQPYCIQSRTINLSAAIGAAQYRHQPLTELSAEADTQMYIAKRTGAPLSYASAASAAHFERSEILAALDNALSTGHILLAQQPIVDLVSRQTRGHEYLMRLRSKSGQILVPSMFLPVAREVGSLTRLTLMMTHQIAVKWDKHSPNQIHFNLPPDLAIEPKLREKIIESLPENKVDRHRITIEVTEERDVNLEALSEAVQDFRNHGFKVAIDDFGHANSSLARLASTNFDIIKLDRSLILASERGQPVILESVIRIAERLNTEVIIEGIETVKQYQLAKDAGISLGQGYLFTADWQKASFAD